MEDGGKWKVREVSAGRTVFNLRRRAKDMSKEEVIGAIVSQDGLRKRRNHIQLV